MDSYLFSEERRKSHIPKKVQISWEAMGIWTEVMNLILSAFPIQHIYTIIVQKLKFFVFQAMQTFILLPYYTCL